MRAKKVRGQKRRLEKLLKNIDSIKPYQNTDGEFEHFHVPSSSWIEMQKTSGNIKTAFMRKWLQKAEEIINQKPEDIPFCKVAAVISEPFLCASQIIIFYSESYYISFWDRNGPYQTWTLIEDKKKSLSERRNISTVLHEKGYLEILTEDDCVQKAQLWFYGELPSKN